MHISIRMLLVLGLMIVGNVSADSPPVDAVAGLADTVTHGRGFSYRAPTGWTVKTSASSGSSTACYMVSEHDCAAIISIVPIYHAGSLEKYAEDRFGQEKTVLSSSTVEQSKLEPYVTQSGWSGFKGTETVTTNGKSDHRSFYFFPGPDDFKIEMQTNCHDEDATRDVPLFEAVAKTLTREKEQR